MFKKMTSAMILAVMFGVGALTSSATLADDHASAVEARQKAMKSFGGHMKAIAGFVKGGAGTAEEAAGHADSLAEKATKLAGLFEVKVTQDESGSVAKNRAKAEIWDDKAGFQAAANRLSAEATAMAAALRSGDADSHEPAFSSLGGNACGACHKVYRGPKQ